MSGHNGLHELRPAPNESPEPTGAMLQFMSAPNNPLIIRPLVPQLFGLGGLGGAFGFGGGGGLRISASNVPATKPFSSSGKQR
jgi:hypothetical protein